MATRWIVTRDIAPWRDEIAWMSLYFSTAVWGSLTLAGFGLVKHLLPRYRVRAPLGRPTRQPVAVTVRIFGRNALKPAHKLGLWTVGIRCPKLGESSGYRLLGLRIDLISIRLQQRAINCSV